MLRFGIIGTGAIATQFVREAKNAKVVDVVAVVARDFVKTQQFAKQHGIECAYETIEQFLADQTIDCVYIATFHPTHAQYSIQALQAGKHVLCEKPAALTVEQIKKVIDVAKSQKKLFMEAMTLGFQPVYQEVKEIIKSGVIGKVQAIQSSFGKVSQKAHKHKASEAGGALYDIGIYNLFLNWDLLGKSERQIAVVQMHQCWDVIGTVQVIQEYAENIQAYSFMSIDKVTAQDAFIMGEKGAIRLLPVWTTAQGYELLLNNQEKQTKMYGQKLGWLIYELKAFVDLVENGQLESPIMPHEYSLGLQEEIASIHQHINFHLPAELMQEI